MGVRYIPVTAQGMIEDRLTETVRVPEITDTEEVGRRKMVGKPDTCPRHLYSLPLSEPSSVEQNRGFRFECFRNPENVDERDVLLPTFDLSDIGPVQVAQLGKIFLAGLQLPPFTTNRVPQQPQLWFAL